MANDNDSDDSSVSSEGSFVRQRNLKSAALGKKREASDNDDDDDYDSDADNLFSPPRRRRRGRGNSKPSIDQRLARIENLSILKENRRREAQQQKHQQTLKSDSDDDNDEKEVSAVVDNKNSINPTNNKSKNMNAEFFVDLTGDDDDDLLSDDGDYSVHCKPAASSSAKNLMKELDVECQELMANAERNRQKLERLQRQSNPDEEEQCDYWMQQHYERPQPHDNINHCFLTQQNDINQAVASHGQPYALQPTNSFGNKAPRVLKVIVKVEIETVDKTEKSKHQTITLQMRSDQDFAALNQSLVEQLQLKTKPKAIFKYKKESVGLGRTPERLGITGNQFTVQAKIVVAGSVAGAKKIANGTAPTQQNWGRMLTLKLRTVSSQKVYEVKQGEKQPFRDMAERLRQLLGASAPQASGMKFDFDGEVLDMNKTPQQFEMEDEDLIDVKGV